MESTAQKLNHTSELIPATNAEVFKGHEKACFWVGKVAVGSEIINPQLYDALGQLRANVYVKEMHFLKEDVLDECGRECDIDDDRAINFVVVENKETGTTEEDRIVGSGRLVFKTDMDRPLPIEKYFSEIFEDKPIASNSVEVSRFISRHEDPRTQHLVSLAVIRTLTLNAISQGVNEAYCIIERPLMVLLGKAGIPMHQLSDIPKDLPEYGGVLYPVKIIPQEVADIVNDESKKNLLLSKFFSNQNGNCGQGFYNRSLNKCIEA